MLIKNITLRLLWIVLMLAISACSQTHSVKNESNTNLQVISIETGKASYYADKYQGRQTANGERFNQNALTAAHKTLRFGTKVKVINPRNGKSVIVRINDRGPFIKGRIIDLSKKAFTLIAEQRLGVVAVRIEVLK